MDGTKSEGRSEDDMEYSLWNWQREGGYRITVRLCSRPSEVWATDTCIERQYILECKTSGYFMETLANDINYVGQTTGGLQRVNITISDLFNNTETVLNFNVEWEVQRTAGGVRVFPTLKDGFIPYDGRAES